MIRAATRADVALLVGYVRETVGAMAAHGGHPVGDDDEPWRDLAADIDIGIDDPSRCYRIGDGGGLIAHAARIDDLFAPIHSLHVSIVYVEPHARRQGLGRALLEDALTWGRAAGCTRADLHVLPGNPARRLYEALGFTTFQLELARPL